MNTVSGTFLTAACITGRAGELHWLLYVLAALFVGRYTFL